MRKFLIVANWKANPPSLKEAIELSQNIEKGTARYKNAEIVIAPPYPFLFEVRKVLKKSGLGAQNAFWKDAGPYTGEVSWRHLKNLGVGYVIVGHSERKIHLGETDEMINKKVLAVLGGGLKVILCVGERERAESEISLEVGEQLKNAIAGVKKAQLNRLVVAYEPVWAISTSPGSQPDTPDNAFRNLLYIRKIISDIYGRTSAEPVRVIYGGSVDSKNIRAFLTEAKMEGALVGGASLDPDEFAKIVKAAKRYQ